MSTIPPVAGTPDLAALLAAGDIQGAIQLVMGNRVKLLDTQLAQQIQAVQDRNDQISKLNSALAALNTLSQYYGSDPSSKVDPKNDTAWWTAYNNQVAPALVAAGIPLPDTGATFTTRAEFDGYITKMKGMIDTASNNQQMDMLRLQSLNNKRDEAFDLLTNTQKSFHDTTSGIIRNL